MNKYLVIITNCRAYDDRRHMMLKSVCNVLFKPFKIRYFFYVGDSEQDQEYIVNGDMIKVKCGDTYDNLALKLLKIYTYVFDNFKDQYKGILKIDDDVVFEDWVSIHNMINNYKGDLFGHIFHPHETGRDWHFGKSKDPVKNKTLYSKTVDFDWIQGNIYYVSMNAVSKIVDYYHKNINNLFEDEWYDDIFICRILLNSSILPQDFIRVVERDKMIYAKPNHSSELVKKLINN